ncbi:MAG: rod shape-determining protein RodA [Planctomycetes bacterium]|nr:rod shape-determining protein RodA [Planctomycetota bacterium]
MTSDVGLVFLRRVNWPLVFLAGALMAIGVGAVLSASHVPGDAGDFLINDFAQRQLFWIAGGLAVALVVALVPYATWGRLSWVIYVAAILLVAAVFLFGVSRGGARRWLRLPYMLIQPSEFVKIALILALAHFYRDRPHGRLLAALAPPLFLAGLPMVLIALQPDLGTALVLLPVTLAMLFAAGASKRHLAATLLACVALSPLLYFNLKPYQRERITGFLDGSVEKAYQQYQSKVAIGSGGLLGKGYMQGTQNILEYLPERHTDFIFSTIAEEWGLVGGLILLALYFAFLATATLSVYFNRDRMARLLAVGVVTLFATQLTVNVGMTLGLMPITGLTLPFISYGGSSLLTSSAGLGLVLGAGLHRRSSVAATEKDDA